MDLRNTLLAGALTLLATATTTADARRTDVDHVGLYNFTVEIGGVDAGTFASVVELDGHGGDGPLLALEDGVIRDELLWAWLDAEGKPLELTLVERDAKGTVIAREVLRCQPLTLVLDNPEGGLEALSTPDAIEQAATENEPDDEYGIIIWIIYVGD
jgi:hypothetical protein